MRLALRVAFILLAFLSRSCPFWDRRYTNVLCVRKVEPEILDEQRPESGAVGELRDVRRISPQDGNITIHHGDASISRQRPHHDAIDERRIGMRRRVMITDFEVHEIAALERGYPTVDDLVAGLR